MVRIWCSIRPHQLEEVKTAVAALDISGLTVSDVRGSGDNPERAVSFAGEEMLIRLPIRAKLEIACEEDLVEDVVEAIIRQARTGEPGDGKIFVEPLQDVLRIRTGDRGPSAL